MPYKDRERRLAASRERSRRFRERNPDYGKQYKSENKEKAAEYEKRHRELFPLRDVARQRVGRRVQGQIWPRPPVFTCTDCSAPAEHYHHEDYSIWWSVEPLCRACHGKRHRKV